MGFILSQVVNKFVPIKRTDDDLRENPFQTATGQEIVSVQESFLARLFREGRPRNVIVQGASASANVTTLPAYITPSPGCEFYPLYLCVSSNADCQLMVRYDTQIADAGSSGIFYDVAFFKAGTPLIRQYNGEIKVFENGQVSIGVLSSMDCKVYGSIYGIEVTTNA
jgi:hypothetical protein